MAKFVSACIKNRYGVVLTTLGNVKRLRVALPWNDDNEDSEIPELEILNPFKQDRRRLR